MLQIETTVSELDITMPRNYKTPAGSVQYKKQDPGLIEKAVEYQEETEGEEQASLASLLSISYLLRRMNTFTVKGSRKPVNPTQTIILTNSTYGIGYWGT
ncbi:uncharacterized protein LOC108252884 isoform X3 [Diaphorina citri]|uniref:Uncharacterized protein LOC108252884 isoform X3 n=1 Tax=Diaphorina citri TaxID=121845 RepID=A0A1S4EG91_DIACI|nr:uncharacterized protein LOC108252884 isoform X3 [Diaphorina citri]